MSIKRVTPAELPWVNQHYEHIGFQPSSLDNEIIAIMNSMYPPSQSNPKFQQNITGVSKDTIKKSCC